MPETTTTDWVCSRCGNGLTIQHDPKKPGEVQPRDWTRVYYVTPPRGSMDIAKACGDLCDPCGGLLVDFMSGKDIAEEMARAMEMSRIEKWAEENVELATQVQTLQAELARVREVMRSALAEIGVV
jgi:hypothetical protein